MAPGSLRNPHIMTMKAYAMLSSSSDAVAMRCRSSDTTSLSARETCNQLSIRRSPLQLPHAQRRPLLNAAARCSYSPAERSQQTWYSQTLQAPSSQLNAVQILQASVPLWMLTAAPALAADADFSQGSASQGSYYATLFLFVSTIPGLWSLVKRAPKSSVKRKVFEVPGPGVAGAVPLDARARAVFAYFKKYNYEVKDRGEVIKFVGNYAASKGQAAALVLYVFFGLGSAALVLSIAAPFGGNLWYLITLISPAAGAYYLRKGDRQEEYKVKMVTADDEQTTDIITEGDVEETTRFCRELELQEKGKEYVKGILER